MATVNQIVKGRKFSNSTELIGFLQKNFVFKVDHESEHVYILDKSNPDRQMSKEFKVNEDKDKKLYLEEV